MQWIASMFQDELGARRSPLSVQEPPMRGRLYLTNKHLVFSPNLADLLVGGQMFCVPLAEVLAAKVMPKRHSLGSLFTRESIGVHGGLTRYLRVLMYGHEIYEFAADAYDRLLIHSRDGGNEIFIVEDPLVVAEFIERAVAVSRE